MLERVRGLFMGSHVQRRGRARALAKKLALTIGVLLIGGAILAGRPLRSGETPPPLDRAAFNPPPVPSLRMELPWENPASFYGWGTIRFWATPEDDEVQVYAIVDAPSDRVRWSGCGAIELLSEGGDPESAQVPAQYIGTPLRVGRYEAVQIEIDIGRLREMARRGRIEGKVCGDPLVLDHSRITALRDFVEQFDRLAAPTEESVPSEVDHGPAPLDPGLHDEELEAEEPSPA